MPFVVICNLLRYFTVSLMRYRPQRGPNIYLKCVAASELRAMFRTPPAGSHGCSSLGGHTGVDPLCCKFNFGHNFSHITDVRG